MENDEKKVKFFVKELLTLNLYALHAITMWKFKILCKDIGNFKKKNYCKQKYAEKLQILCKNIGNWKKITAKLLQPKSSASKQYRNSFQK